MLAVALGFGFGAEFTFVGNTGGPNNDAPLYAVAPGTAATVALTATPSGGPASASLGYQINFGRSELAAGELVLDTFAPNFALFPAGADPALDTAAGDNIISYANFSPQTITGEAQLGTFRLQAPDAVGSEYLLTIDDQDCCGIIFTAYLDNETTLQDVYILVGILNEPPVATDDTATVDEDGSVDVDVLGNDTDPDGDNLSIQSVSNPANGTATISGGVVVYEPDANFNGNDSFTYVVSDGNDTDEGTVTVTVSATPDAPVANNINQTAEEDGQVTFAANATDPDGDTLTVTAVSNPANGTATVEADGRIKYVPDPEFNGNDSFTYTVSDPGGLTDTANVNMTVLSVNDLPTAVDDQEIGVPETAILIDVLANDTDPEGDNLSISNVGNPSNGTAVVQAGQVLYTPNAGFTGPTDSFTYTISDGNGGMDTATVTLLFDIGDPPVGVDDDVSGLEDQPKVIQTSDLLSNDQDPNLPEDVLSFVSATDGGNGTVTDNGDGTITYEGNLNFNGADTFTYTLRDRAGNTSSADVTITLAPANDDPTAVDDNRQTLENTPQTFDPAANDTDIDGDTPLRVISVSNMVNGTAVLQGGQVTFTPAFNFNGAASYDYIVSDNNGGTDSGRVNIEVLAENSTPVARNDQASGDEDTVINVDVLANDTDPDGPAVPLTIRILSANNGAAAVNDNGTPTPLDDSIDFTPNANYNGTASVQYLVSDGIEDSNTATAIIGVNPVNDDPTAVDDKFTAAAASTFDVLGNDTDAPDVGELLTIVSAGPSANGATITTDGATVSYTPPDGFSGTDTFEYTITDGNGGSATATVEVIASQQRYFRDGENLVFLGTEGRDRIIVQPLTFNNLNILIRTQEGNFGPLPLGNGQIVISGLGGNDVISVTGNLKGSVVIDGGAGNDRLVGGTGDDILLGGPGNDEILGGEGANTLDGGDGNDRLIGRGGDEVLLGGGGNDLLLGSSGADWLDGGDGRDSLSGGSGKDILMGGDGDDVLDGGGDDDLLSGDDGNDTLKGNAGDDVLIGGLGVDGVNGSKGQDGLYGGTADDDADLAAILAAWSAESTLPARVAAISGLLSDNDDGEEDNLIGGGAPDWFGSSGDRRVDFGSSDFD